MNSHLAEHLQSHRSSSSSRRVREPDRKVQVQPTVTPVRGEVGSIHEPEDGDGGREDGDDRVTDHSGTATGGIGLLSSSPGMSSNGVTESVRNDGGAVFEVTSTGGA